MVAAVIVVVIGYDDDIEMIWVDSGGIFDIFIKSRSNIYDTVIGWNWRVDKANHLWVYKSVQGFQMVQLVYKFQLSTGWGVQKGTVGMQIRSILASGIKDLEDSEYRGWKGFRQYGGTDGPEF